MHAERQLLDVENDVRHILADTRDGGELMQHTVDLHRRHGSALQRRHQHAPQRIAERQAEAAFERFRDHGRETLGVMARIDLKLVRLDQLFPVLLDHVLNLVPLTDAGASGRANPPSELFNVPSTIHSCERT